MFKLLVFILICYGLSNILIYSKGPFNFFVKFREIIGKISSSLGELFGCMMCLPFWIGISLSLIDIFLLKEIALTPLNIIIPFIPGASLWYILLVIILDGVISSGSTWILHNIEEFFEKH